MCVGVCGQWLRRRGQLGRLRGAIGTRCRAVRRVGACLRRLVRCGWGLCAALQAAEGFLWLRQGSGFFPRRQPGALFSFAGTLAEATGVLGSAVGAGCRCWLSVLFVCRGGGWWRRAAVVARLRRVASCVVVRRAVAAALCSRGCSLLLVVLRSRALVCGGGCAVARVLRAARSLAV